MNRSWIKGLGKNPLKSEFVHCWQCLFVRGYWTANPRTPRNDCVYTSQAPWWHGMHGVLTRLPPRHTNRSAHLDTLPSAVPKTIACLYGLRCELVKELFDEFYYKWENFKGCLIPSSTLHEKCIKSVFIFLPSWLIWQSHGMLSTLTNVDLS